MRYHKTKALEKHKQQVQQAFDFAVTVCYAIPQLQAHIADVNAGKATLISPYYFAPQTTAGALEKNILTFENRLSSYLLLSLFSFFEAFINDVVQEMLDFHGGAREFIALAQRRERARIAATQEPAVANSVNKLRSHKKGKEQKYEKHTALLETQGYRFPSERMSSYGVRMLVERHKNLRAFAIPDLLEYGLLIPLTRAEKKQYDKIRVQRNDIAHGKKSHLTLVDVRNTNDYFRDMTFRVNTHLLQHFFIVERYAT